MRRAIRISRIAEKIPSVLNLAFSRFNEVSNLSYLIRWTILGIIIGSIAGGAAIAFSLGVEFFTTIFLDIRADFIPPSPSSVVSNLPANPQSQITGPDSNNNSSPSGALQNFLSLENNVW
jgi:hypothetical protein